ncbi:MAG: MogA/MoaB family molybdenum cofactor biosynthesis protein [Synergistaceae bacterium]|jgi:molybdenum cofactor synthesis domain-containing protein|nr:MogA/MoaB family molybdenum cofactor biosynthesis protein [Synergistaceae bacterium]
MARILGLYDVKRDKWDKLAYIHSGADGTPCVNGEPAGIVIHCAGEDMPLCADYAIIIPKGLSPLDEGYMAINSGEALIRLSRDSASVINSGFIGVSAKVELWRVIKAGVLTVSDKASRGERQDTAGPALESLVEALGATVVKRATVPDEQAAIASLLREWADISEDEGLHLILTTGGTGLSKRDVTPEALLEVHDKLVPGFGEIMRSRSMLHTPRGYLSRNLAVVRGSSLIIAFPGSEKAVRQCFAAIAQSLRHGIEILNGWDAECGGHVHSDRRTRG